MPTAAHSGLELTGFTDVAEIKRSNRDNRLSSDKRRHLRCRTFESTSALVVHADVRCEFAEDNDANWFP